MLHSALSELPSLVVGPDRMIGLGRRQAPCLEPWRGRFVRRRQRRRAAGCRVAGPDGTGRAAGGAGSVNGAGVEPARAGRLAQPASARRVLSAAT